MAAAIAAHETAAAAASTNKNALDSNAISNQGTQLCMKNLVDLFTKLNPSAKEFFPSRHSDKSSPDLEKRRIQSGTKKVQWKSIQSSASLKRCWLTCSVLVDKAALSLGGMMIGYYPVRVLPSKTAILPVNPSYLPKSEYEREMCARTVYCTNIDKIVSQTDVKSFFETACGKVTLLRLLGDQLHSTHIAFIEFAVAESAIAALSCSGMVLGTQPIRESPSKPPVRPRVSRPSEN